MKFGEKLGAALRGLEIKHEKSPLGGVVTASIGVAASIPNADIDPASLLFAADQALYDAKGAGRNRVTYYKAP